MHDDRSLKEMGQDLLRLGSVIHYGNKLRPEEKFPNQSLFQKFCIKLHNFFNICGRGIVQSAVERLRVEKFRYK